MIELPVIVVIDGEDGTGKTGQTEKAVERGKKEGYEVKTIDFPQYSTFFGKMIAKYLRGEFGKTVSAELASVLYALNRWELKNQLEQWAATADLVLFNRYVSSNQLHQGGKIVDPKQRKRFFNWLYVMEFKELKIPRPDMVIYLDMPLELSMQLSKTAGKRKKYLKGKDDIHEKDYNHLKAAKESAVQLLEIDKSWVKVDCVEGGRLLTPDQIHENVWEKILTVLKK